MPRRLVPVVGAEATGAAGAAGATGATGAAGAAAAGPAENEICEAAWVRISNLYCCLPKLTHFD